MSDNNKIYAECINEGAMQVAGLKLTLPTNVSLTNRDEAVEIKWTDPDDLQVSGVTLAYWEGTIVVRKVGSYPTSRLDGTIVCDSKRRNEYQTNGFIDDGLTNEIEYYYGIFPYTEDNVYNYKCVDSITPQPIYPDKPISVKVTIGNTKLKVRFELPDNATSAKISYSKINPEDNSEPYGTTIGPVESPCTVSDLENDTEYYITVYSCNEKRSVPYDTIVKVPREAEIYGMIIDNKEPNPDQKITYIADNKNYNPAYMDYEEDKFNYGDWADAFFMDVKPCMLKSNGEVDYYLDPDDYSKKLNSDDNSEITDESYDGNVMIEFPKIYWKVEDNGDGTGTVYISDLQLDDNYVCWSNIDNNGNEIDHFYVAAYDGSLINNKLRSLSGKAPLSNKTNRQQEITYSKANNQDTNVVIWYTWVFCDLQLLRLLCLLVSKSTNSQEKFGYGHCIGRDSETVSGYLNNKGLFYGSQNKSIPMKAFGIENIWGNMWKSVAGYICDRGTQKVKMTYGRSDGSEVDGYNTDGSGYVTISGVTPTGTNTGYITSIKITPFGLIPYEAASNGTDTTHYCDGLWFNNSQNNYAIVGSGTVDDLRNGIFCTSFYVPTSSILFSSGAAISCKPLAKVS